MIKSTILEDFLKSVGKINTKKPIIICGRPGPTGKTSLCDILRTHGSNVIEISDGVSSLVKYLDDKNHYIEEEYYYLIVLNERVR
jgi:broad-specificity NMP kinase